MKTYYTSLLLLTASVSAQKTPAWKRRQQWRNRLQKTQDQVYDSRIANGVNNAEVFFKEMQGVNRRAAAETSDSGRLKIQMDRIITTAKQIVVDRIVREQVVPQAIDGAGQKALGDSNSLRGSVGNGFFDLSSIWEYGCWCSFGDKMALGRGAPVNHIDSACRNMTLCMKCIEHDSEDKDMECDPTTIEYNAPIAKPGEYVDVGLQCRRSNRRNECKLWTCTCETEFAAKLVDFFFTGEPFEKQYQHSAGFDPALQCSVNDKSHGGGTSNDGKSQEASSGGPENGGRNLAGANSNVQTIQHACCGNYPGRKPYNAATRECCNPSATVYNTKLHECCIDGSVRDIGMC